MDGSGRDGARSFFSAQKRAGSCQAPGSETTDGHSAGDGHGGIPGWSGAQQAETETVNSRDCRESLEQGLGGVASWCVTGADGLWLVCWILEERRKRRAAGARREQNLTQPGRIGLQAAETPRRFRLRPQPSTARHGAGNERERLATPQTTGCQQGPETIRLEKSSWLSCRLSPRSIGPMLPVLTLYPYRIRTTPMRLA